MYSDRIKVFHIADCDSSIICITDNLIFYLLVALYAFFYKHLMDRRECKSLFHHILKLITAICKTAASSAKSKCRAKDNRVAYLFCSIKCFLYTICYLRRNNRLAYPFAKLLKELSVLSTFYTIAISSKKLYRALIKNTIR